jgi:hypothetical protein
MVTSNMTVQASRDPSLLPVSFQRTIIDQDLVHALLENEPDRLDAFKYAEYLKYSCDFFNSFDLLLSFEPENNTDLDRIHAVLESRSDRLKAFKYCRLSSSFDVK